jgi:hypothetical protein
MVDSAYVRYNTAGFGMWVAKVANENPDVITHDHTLSYQ